MLETYTSSAPIGSDGVSGSGDWMPILRAVWMIMARPSLALPWPSAIESFTGMTLIECVMASSSVTVPEKPPE